MSVNFIEIMKYESSYSKNIGDGIIYTGTKTIVSYQLYSTSPIYANGNASLSGIVNARTQAEKNPNKIVQISLSSKIEGDGRQILDKLFDLRGMMILNRTCCKTVYYSKGSKILYNNISYDFEEMTEICVGYAKNISSSSYDYSLSFSINGYIGKASITIYQ